MGYEPIVLPLHHPRYIMAQGPLYRRQLIRFFIYQFCIASLTILLYQNIAEPRWSEWRDLNSRPQRPKRRALPTALHSDIWCHFYCYSSVPSTGFTIYGKPK